MTKMIFPMELRHEQTADDFLRPSSFRFLFVHGSASPGFCASGSAFLANPWRSSSCNASSAVSKRPAAFRRGRQLKEPTVHACRVFSGDCATCFQRNNAGAFGSCSAFPGPVGDKECRFFTGEAERGRQIVPQRDEIQPAASNQIPPPAGQTGFFRAPPRFDGGACASLKARPGGAKAPVEDLRF